MAPRTFNRWCVMRSTKAATAASASAMICILLFSGCSYAVVGAGVSDFASTQYAISKGASEANPAMKGGAVSQAIKKAAGISGVLAAAHLLDHREHRTLARIVRATAIVVWSSATVHNVLSVR